MYKSSNESFIALVSTKEHPVVTSGCILNQFDEHVICASECTVINVDKKQLKTICMLLRWKYLGQGLLRSRLLEGMINGRSDN